MKIEIPMKLPSLNEYINACKNNRFFGGNMKKQVEDDISWYLRKMPMYEVPIKIKFTWIEKNRKRDLDNVCFAKKFILDAMQKCGKISNDNPKYVRGFEDKFEYGDDYKVIVEIEDVE